jgi:hypothetical protein
MKALYAAFVIVFLLVTIHALVQYHKTRDPHFRDFAMVFAPSAALLLYVLAGMP